MKLRCVWLLCVLGTLIFIGGCGTSEIAPLGGGHVPLPPTPPALPITVSVSPQTAAIGTGQTLQFKRNGDKGYDGGYLDDDGGHDRRERQLYRSSWTAKRDGDGNGDEQGRFDHVCQRNSERRGARANHGDGERASRTLHDLSGSRWQVHVQFGLDTTYVLTTWAYPAASVPVFTVTTTAGMTPKSGVELLARIDAGRNGSAGSRVGRRSNIFWADNPGLPGVLNPIKFLPHDLIISMRHQN